MSFLAAAVQFEPTWGKPEQNLARLLDLSLQAVQAGAKLIVWPEMATSGYIFTGRGEIAPFVEPVPGPTSERVAAFCKTHGVHIVAGLAERDPRTDLYYNSAVLVDHHGLLLGTYRKTHLWGDDTRWAAPGSAVPAWNTDLGRLAILICRDADFPEAARLAARQGALLVAHLTNWLGPAPSPAWRTRAAENGLYWVATNRWGEERGVRFTGGSAVIGPDGAVFDTRAEGDGIVVAAVNPGRVREVRASEPRTAGSAALARHYPDIVLNPYLYSAKPVDRPAAHVAVIQAGERVSSPPGVRDACAARLLELASGAASPDLVVLPALVQPGDVTGARDVAAWAEPLPGPSTDWLLEWARRLEAHIVTTLLEWSDGDVYLATVAVGPDGIVGRHRAEVLPDEAGAWCSPGNGADHLDLPFGRVGLLTAAELEFPEPIRLLALRGCRVVAAPGGGEQGRTWLWSQRATENQVWLAVANRDGAGGSFVYGDRSEEEARAPLAEAGSHVYQVPGYAPWVDDRSLLRMRPVHLYEPLCDVERPRE